MKQLLIVILFSIIMTTNITAQPNKQLLEDEKLVYFQSKVNIPSEYQFERVVPIEVDKMKANLYRYEKVYNKGIGSEHFSFIVTDDKPYKILGFTQMDAKFLPQEKQLSEEETEKIAREFLVNIDLEYSKSLSNLWTDVHDEQITVNGKQQTVRGMKYKCYRKSRDDYAWVVVSGAGEIITYEREILWQYEQKRRISEMYLHDSWLAINDREDIEKVINESFLQGVANALDTEAMAKGFHPDFAILIPNDEAIHKLPIATWIDVIKKFKTDEKRVNSGERKLEHTLNILDVTDDVAVVKIELYRKKQLITTDYMFVSRLSDGWKITSKTSNEHVTNPFNI